MSYNIIDLPIGTVFLFNRTTLQVVESVTFSCYGCYFFYNQFGCNYSNYVTDLVCLRKDRQDGKLVIFKKVEGKK